MMFEVGQIYEAIESYIDRATIRPDSDLYEEQGIYGDDFDEMLQKYQETFKVDMTQYLWYFHTEEEGSLPNFSSGLFRPPNERVSYIPVTPQMLLDFANKGKWELNYPPHTLPKRR